MEQIEILWRGADGEIRLICLQPVGGITDASVVFAVLSASLLEQGIIKVPDQNAGWVQ